MSKKLIYLVSFILLLSFVLTSGAWADLVGWWMLDEGSGTTVHDSSGSGNDGTFSGDPQWVAGKVGGALEFDGGDYVDVPGVADINPESITLATWVYFNEVDSAVMERQDYLSRGDDYAFSLHEWAADQKIWAIVTSAGDWSVIGGQTVVEPDTWYHTAMTYDADTQMLILYLDGEVDGELSVPGGLEHRLGGSLTIGTYNGRDLLGRLDDIKIWDEALSQVEIKGAMAGQVWPYAWGPLPKDGALHADTWVNLSWSPGGFAVSHDVYLGDNFDNVNDGAEGTFQGNQAATFIVAGFPGFPYPDGLVPGTTYYWRIDEVNDAEPNSPWKGSVWSFMIPPKTAYAPDPADAAELVDPDVTLSWTGGFGAKLHTVYFGDNFDDVNNAAGGLPQGIASYTPGTLKLAKIYYWRVDEFDVFETYKGDVWSFTTQGAVVSLKPANGAVDVKQTQILTFSPGDYAASHEVYFGTDKEVVRNADTGSPEYKGTRDLGSESYDPGKLEWETTYYWRIDEVNNANPDSPWAGPVWSFTTANFLVVDDFESYNDIDPPDPESNRIFEAWADGYDIPTNGALVGNELPPYAEQSIVHSGIQSMPYIYDNSVGNSEATLTLTYPRDWTENGVSTLTIWFRGDSANAAETLYVALNGSAVVNHDNPDAAQIEEWTQWNIDLQVFADQGVNLANVNTIGLGLGDRNNPQAGGSGTMYFDDIRLYQPPPVDPNIDGLVAYYAFENDANDSSGSGLHGTVVGDPAYVEGLAGYGMAMDFDGTDDLVELGKFDVVGGITLAVWIKADDFEINDARVISKAKEWGGDDHFWMLSTMSETSLRFRLKTDEGPGTATLISDPVLEAGVWTHVVAAWDGSMMRIYKDGVEVASQEKGGSAVAVDPSVSVAIGSQPSDAFASDPSHVAKFFDGLLDEVRIYDRALSDLEVRYLAGDR